MSAKQNLTLSRKYRFNTETELMEALLIKCLKPPSNIKVSHCARVEYQHFNSHFDQAATI